MAICGRVGPLPAETNLSAMILIKTVSQLKQTLASFRRSELTIGFVPTMGALHEGHISLLQAARQENPITVVSVFVNPTQFNNAGDFEKYPQTLSQDIRLLEEAGATLLFLPSVAEMYPQGTADMEHYALGFLETVLEGAYRPGHFQGVCQVVSRLLDQVEPDHLYMGSKDYQQCMVVKKLIELKNSPVVLHTCPTRRETDGLAMSSRNLRLNAEEREKAPAIYQCLQYLQSNLQPGPLQGLTETATQNLTEAGFKVDYVAIHQADNLAPITQWDGHTRLVGLVAAYLNEVRLIDNLVLNENID